MAASQTNSMQELAILKEKIRLKKLDKEVFVHENESALRRNNEEIDTLRVGNVCLNHMTHMNDMMSITFNAAIFTDHPNSEKLRMGRMTLEQSIAANDSKLFKLGKRLLKQDYIRGQKEKRLADSVRDLNFLQMEIQGSQDDYDKECQEYLHKQVMVQDSRDREISAKLLYQRFTKLLDELQAELDAFAPRCKQKEKKMQEETRELRDFIDLRDRAKRYLTIEQNKLKPLNKEMARVTNHFEGLILATKNEMDDRRKKGALAKFLAEREAHPLSFVTTSNLMDVKYKKRHKSLLHAYETMMTLKEAMMVSDIDHVVECLLDQADVSNLLKAEKELRQDWNSALKAKLASLWKNNMFLKYDMNRSSRFRTLHQKAVAEEAEESKEFEREDNMLRRQDKLMSSVHLAVHALIEKLRPIKLDDPMNLASGDLLHDIKVVIAKMDMMISVINTNVVPIGRVKPIMLHLFKEKRLPSDYCRAETNQALMGSSMSTFETFESDQPGLVTRDMLKTRAAESCANKKKKGPAKKDRKSKK